MISLTYEGYYGGCYEALNYLAQYKIGWHLKNLIEFGPFNTVAYLQYARYNIALV